MYNSFDYSDSCPQQETNFLSNSSPFHFGHERINPFFDHQNYLPHQMGIFLPQTLDQDPNPTITLPNIDTQDYHSPSFPYNPSAPYEIFTYNQAPLGFPSSPRKDRHTKISTAQGVRDRRVRLSMAIAREFFDLQDMLGFDKASKTIGWLLAKSKSAIQELALEKKSSDLSRSSFDYSSRPSTRKRSCKSSASASYSKEEIIEKNSVENQANFVVARKNRAKARARARERTREKLSGRAKTVIQNDDLGLQTSATTVSSSKFVVEKEGCNAPTQNLNGLNVIRSPHSLPSPLISCSDYLQNLTSSDQGDSNNLASLLLGSKYNSEAGAICSSFFGLEHLYFSNRNAHDPGNPWEELSNNVCAPIER